MLPYCSDGPETGDVRRANYQRVRVYLSETWNDATNSSIDWTKENSEVVCRQLGYPNSQSVLFIFSMVL